MDFEKPIKFRPETWEWVQHQWLGLKKEEQNSLLKNAGYPSRMPWEEVLDEPAALLFSLGFLKHLELVTDSIIQLENGVEYRIDHAAAMALSKENGVIVLMRLFDQKKFAVTRKQIIEAFRQNNEFDQLDRKEIISISK